MFKNENVSLNVFYIYYVSDFYAFVSRYFHFIDRIQSHSKNILFICRPYHCWCSATYLRTLLAAYSLSFGRNFYRAILVVTQDFSSSGLQTTQSPFFNCKWIQKTYCKCDSQRLSIIIFSNIAARRDFSSTSHLFTPELHLPT